MVNSIVLICEDSPFGKNSVVESIRMATGILAVGDIDDCKVILLNDAVYFLSKNLSPESLEVDPFDNIMRLMELSDLEIYIHDLALEERGMEGSDLISGDNVRVVSMQKISQIIAESDMSFKY
jgi:sulfur relay (sulfurtransferase) DsrF/TusC family protein